MRFSRGRVSPAEETATARRMKIDMRHLVACQPGEGHGHQSLLGGEIGLNHHPCAIIGPHGHLALHDDGWKHRAARIGLCQPPHKDRPLSTIGRRRLVKMPVIDEQKLLTRHRIIKADAAGIIDTGIVGRDHAAHASVKQRRVGEGEKRGEGLGAQAFETQARRIGMRKESGLGKCHGILHRVRHDYGRLFPGRHPISNEAGGRAYGLSSFPCEAVEGSEARSMTQAEPRGQIASVQVLRALAALTVVFGHAQHDALVTAGKAGLAFARNHLLPWGAGVDLFFVISGFIMVYASGRLFGQSGAGRAFLIRRLIRIVPLYWLLATAYLILSRNFGGTSAAVPLTGADLLASYLFWPADIFADGHPRPFFSLGWTLNYEMFFYLVFAIFVGFPREIAIFRVSALLLALVLVGMALPGLPVALAFWAKPIVLEFVLGMLIAQAYLAGFRLPHLAALAMIVAGILVLIADPMGAATKPENWITPNDALRLVCWGVPVSLIMAGLLLIRGSSGSRAHGAFTRFWVGLGDASYALYLIHPFVIVTLRKIWMATGLHHLLGLWPMVAAALGFSVLAAFMSFRLLEKPVTAWLGGQLLPQPSLPSTGKASSR